MAGALGGVSLQAKQNKKNERKGFENLMQNDPEFAEFFEYFIKEQVSQHNELDPKPLFLLNLLL